MSVKMISKNRSNKKKTTEQYIQELMTKNPNVQCCGEYVNANTPILHRCLVCNNEWMAQPSHILNGTGCPTCSYKRGGVRNRITHDQFMENVKDKLNPYVKIVGRYTDSKTKVECECLLCGKKLYITPGNLGIGRGCASCMNRLNNPPKTHAQFIKELMDVNPEVNIESEYVGAKEKILCSCKVCGHKWKSYPTNLLSRHGCPKCGLLSGWDKHRKTTEEYVAKMKVVNPSIKVQGDYITVDTPIEHECSVCGYSWLASPRNICNKQHGCPQCVASHGEQRILHFLIQSNIEYEKPKTFDSLLGINGGLLSYDFYLPSFNLLVEFHGEQHSRAVDLFGGETQLEVQKEHDKRKLEYAQEHGFDLLVIWYYDFNNIEAILQEKLNIGSVETDIGA